VNSPSHGIFFSLNGKEARESSPQTDWLRSGREATSSSHNISKKLPNNVDDMLWREEDDDSLAIYKMRKTCQTLENLTIAKLNDISFLLGF